MQEEQNACSGQQHPALLDDDDDDDDVEDGGDDDHDVDVFSQEEQPARGGQQHPALRLRQPSSLSQHRHQQAEVCVNLCLFKTKNVSNCSS